MRRFGKTFGFALFALLGIYLSARPALQEARPVGSPEQLVFITQYRSVHVSGTAGQRDHTIYHRLRYDEDWPLAAAVSYHSYDNVAHRLRLTYLCVLGNHTQSTDLLIQQMHKSSPLMLTENKDEWIDDCIVHNKTETLEVILSHVEFDAEHIVGGRTNGATRIDYVMMNYPNLLPVLLKYDAEWSDQQSARAYILALSRGKLNQLQTLKAHGISAQDSQDGAFSPLRSWASNYHFARREPVEYKILFHLLVEAGAAPQDKSISRKAIIASALDSALHHDQTLALEMLMQAGYISDDVLKNLESYLLEAIEKKNHNLFNMLLHSTKSDLNQRDTKHRNALYYAVMTHQKEVMIELLKHGADINNHHPDYHPYFATDPSLIPRGPEDESLDCLIYLVENKHVDINLVQSNQNRLFKAIDDNHRFTAYYLLKRGIDLKWKNPDGLTARQYAIKTRRPDIALMIQRHLAEHPPNQPDGLIQDE